MCIVTGVIRMRFLSNPKKIVKQIKDEKQNYVKMCYRKIDTNALVFFFLFFFPQHSMIKKFIGFAYANLGKKISLSRIRVSVCKFYMC